MKALLGSIALAASALSGLAASADTLQVGAILQNLPGTWTPEVAEPGGARACGKSPVKITIRDQGVSFVFDNVPPGGSTTYAKGKLSLVSSSTGDKDESVLRLDERPSKPGAKGESRLLTMPSKDKIYWRSFSRADALETFVRCPVKQ